MCVSGRPTGARWADGPDDGYYFQYLPHHLIGAGRSDELRQLLLDFAWLQAKLEATDVTALIIDYDRLNITNNDDPLWLVQGAIRLSAHMLAGDKQLLAGQLSGRLMAEDSGDIEALMAQAQAWRGADWLRPVTFTLMPPGGPLIRNLVGHTGPVSGVAVTRDGRLALSGSEDYTVKVWDIQSGQKRRTLVGHRKPVFAVAVTPDGRLALSASQDHTVKVWDGKVDTFTADAAIQVYTVTPDGSVIVAGDALGQVHILHLEWANPVLRGR